MGYSVAVASAILFTSLLLCFSFIYMGVNFSIDTVQQGFNDNLATKEAKLHTNLLVNSTNLAMPESEIELLNAGSTEIPTATIDIIVDGWLITENYTMSVEGENTSIWYPGEMLKIQLTNLTHKPEKIKIVAGNGSYALI